MDYVLSPVSAENISSGNISADRISPEDRRIARKLAELRRRHQLTPEEMSVITGVPAEEIRAMESGKSEVPASAVFVISYSMGIAPDELMDVDGAGE